MSGYPLTACCRPDARAERAYLAGLLPVGALPAQPVTNSPQEPGGGPDCAVLAWARSGLMELTGQAGGQPLAPAAPVMARAASVTGAIEELTGRNDSRVALDPAPLLAGRARQRGWQRQGRTSANGTCRLLRAADDWLAISLPRPADIASLPAVLGRELTADPWAELTERAAAGPAASLTSRAQLVGIPAAALGREPPAALTFSPLGQPGQAPGLVLDFSAMWAGPLCARILHQAGWHVVKAEDVRRPDGARSGPPEFYASLHAGIPAVRLDFSSAEGQAELARLAAQAGIIVESSRPRALRRLGLIAEDWLQAAPGRIWISVTGYGRQDPEQRVAFGDDAAAAGGLVAYEPDGSPVFCGDAIADPLTGLHAGLAGLAAHAAGGGWLADVSMAGVCASLIRPAAGPAVSHEVRRTLQGWTVRHPGAGEATVVP